MFGGKVVVKGPADAGRRAGAEGRLLFCMVTRFGWLASVSAPAGPAALKGPARSRRGALGALGALDALGALRALRASNVRLYSAPTRNPNLPTQPLILGTLSAEDEDRLDDLCAVGLDLWFFSLAPESNHTRREPRQGGAVQVNLREGGKKEPLGLSQGNIHIYSGDVASQDCNPCRRPGLA